MAYRDLLLTLADYPETTPPAAIDTAIDLAAAIGARLSAVACEGHFPVPGSFLSPVLLDVGAVAGAEAMKGHRQAEATLDAFQAAAEKAGVFAERIFERCQASNMPSLLAHYARLRDLSIVTAEEDGLGNQPNVEALIFESGRPVLLLPRTRTKPFALNSATIAWDFSRAAARAVADALPLLTMVKRVHIVTVTNEKRIDTMRSGPELAKHLAHHQIDVVLETVDGAGRSIGESLGASIKDHGSDLLVMGAYGHSRLREFVLGGATRSMMADPPLPVLLSH